MKIENLLNFISVADEHSYTRAAQKCFLTQPAIYSQVRQLEGECGFKLFSVAGKDVVLTAEGSEFYTFARAVAREYDSYRIRTQDRERLRAGHVRIGALSHLSTFKEASRRLHSEDPSIVVEFQSHHAIEAIELIREGKLDFGFYGPAFAAADLVFEHCGECAIAVVVPTGHPLAGREVEFDELTNFPMVGYTSGSARRAIDQWLEQHPTSHVRYVAQADSSGASKTLALTVGEPAFVIREAVDDDIALGTLAEVKVRNFDPSFPLFAVYREEDGLGPSARRYLAIVRQIFQVG